MVSIILGSGRVQMIRDGMSCSSSTRRFVCTSHLLVTALATLDSWAAVLAAHFFSTEFSLNTDPYKTWDCLQFLLEYLWLQYFRRRPRLRVQYQSRSQRTLLNLGYVQ